MKFFSVKTQWLIGIHLAFFVAMLIAFGYICQMSTKFLHSEETHKVEKVVDQAMGSLEIQVELYKQALYGTRGFVMSGLPINRHTWVQFFDDNAFVRRLPALAGLGYVERVSSSDLDQVVNRIKKDTSHNGIGYPAFEVYPTPPAEATEIYPLTHIAPGSVESFSKTTGLDYASDPARWAAVQKTRDTARIAITEPINSIDSGQPAFVMLLSWYEPGLPISSEAERRAAFRGIVGAGFRNTDFFDGAFGKLKDEKIKVTVYDGAELNQEKMLYTNMPTDQVLGAETDPAPIINNKDNSITVVRTFDIATRTWTLVFTAPFSSRLPAVSIPFPIFLVALVIGIIVLANVIFRVTFSTTKS